MSRIRNQLGWSQAQLAAKCQLAGWDVSRDIIARIELQIRWVGDFELAALSDVLKTPIDELFPSEMKARLRKHQ
ncbi:MAG TPA: helix-turn-helix transcriptional regulator [Chthoniobacteraceae bacterium]|nr:helix-turn-helix transcriptional regulator [Chthoniobacteraceae bacterium]